jgi:two-component system, chemotaxis family, protein-glutamate methylesterase/glutaminase
VSARTQVVVVAASAGGVKALATLLAALPPDFPAPIVIVQHRTPHGRSLLSRVLGRTTKLRVVDSTPGAVLEPGVVYIAPADFHVTLTAAHTIAHTDGRRIRFLLSSANPLFESAATVFGGAAIAVVLTGSGFDATDGVQAVKAHGGIVIAQDRPTSEHFSMPASAIRTGAVDFVLPLDEIAPALVKLVRAETTPEQVASSG